MVTYIVTTAGYAEDSRNSSTVWHWKWDEDQPSTAMEALDSLIKNLKELWYREVFETRQGLPKCQHVDQYFPNIKASLKTGGDAAKWRFCPECGRLLVIDFDPEDFAYYVLEKAYGVSDDLGDFGLYDEDNWEITNAESLLTSSNDEVLIIPERFENIITELVETNTETDFASGLKQSDEGFWILS